MSMASSGTVRHRSGVFWFAEVVMHKPPFSQTSHAYPEPNTERAASLKQDLKCSMLPNCLEMPVVVQPHGPFVDEGIQGVIGVGERGVEKGIAIVHVYFQQGFLTVYAVEEKT